MNEIDHKHYLALVQNPNFTHKHNPQFLKDFGNVYRNNIHLSPFFRDIRAFADNPEAPEIIIIKKGENLFISANVACDAYDKALYEFLIGCYHEGNEVLWLNISPESLETKINTLFSDYKPERLIRYNFRLNKESFNKLPNWRTQIPSGFSVEYYDTQSVDFLKKHNRIYDCWFPESKRFAFVTLFEGEIVSECFSVFVEENMVEVGIETDKRFRRRGLAFLTSSAFIEHCLNNNLETNWGCWHYNNDSAALAKKLGYELFDEGICVRITKK